MVFNEEMTVTDAIQGNLKNCNFFAVLASIMNLPNGQEFIKNAIPYYNEVNFN